MATPAGRCQRYRVEGRYMLGAKPDLIVREVIAGSAEEAKAACEVGGFVVFAVSVVESSEMPSAVTDARPMSGFRSLTRLEPAPWRRLLWGLRCYCCSFPLIAVLVFMAVSAKKVQDASNFAPSFLLFVAVACVFNVGGLALVAASGIPFVNGQGVRVAIRLHLALIVLTLLNLFVSIPPPFPLNGRDLIYGGIKPTAVSECLKNLKEEYRKNPGLTVERLLEIAVERYGQPER
jgi:hypothetical protein